jgi:hypothetical protein
VPGPRSPPARCVGVLAGHAVAQGGARRSRRRGDPAPHPHGPGAWPELAARARRSRQRAAHRPLEMETASRRQSVTTRLWGSIGSAEIFAEGTAHTTTKWDVHRAGLARYRQGAAGGGRLIELWSGPWAQPPAQANFIHMAIYKKKHSETRPSFAAHLPILSAKVA